MSAVHSGTSDLKLIRLNSAGIDKSDDPSYPYKLEVSLRPPEFMQVAFLLAHGGSEEMIVRAASREALERFIEANNLRGHLRLRRLVITGPDGAWEELQQA